MKTQPTTNRILILALSGLGDALMFTPALELLKQEIQSAEPTAEIDVLCMFGAVREIYERSPHVSRVHFIDFMNISKWEAVKAVIALRSLSFTHSFTVYPANRWEYNVIAFLAGAKKRIAHSYNHLNKFNAAWLMTDLVQEDDVLHNVQENVRLVQRLIPVGGYVNPSAITVAEKSKGELPPLAITNTDEEIAIAKNWISANTSSRRRIGFHAGTAILKNHINRRWAPEKFAELSKKLSKEYSADILLFGGPEERQLNAEIEALSGGTAKVVVMPSLMKSVAVMRECSLFISNDSGLMHVASALRLPVVAIFAYTNPNYVHPWSTRHVIVRKDLPCSPCFYYSPRAAHCQFDGEEKWKCNSLISIEDVFMACKEMIDGVQ